MLRRLWGLQDEIRRSEESRYDHRLHGVLLVAQGCSCGEVARLLGDAPRTVEYWVHRFEERGLGGLREGSRPGRPGRLSAEQIEATQAALRQRPADFGLSGQSVGWQDALGLFGGAARGAVKRAAVPEILSPMGISVA